MKQSLTGAIGGVGGSNSGGDDDSAAFPVYGLVEADAGILHGILHEHSDRIVRELHQLPNAATDGTALAAAVSTLLTQLGEPPKVFVCLGDFVFVLVGLTDLFRFADGRKFAPSAHIRVVRRRGCQV
jgi:hypothetical protein